MGDHLRAGTPYNNNNDRLTAFDPGQPGYAGTRRNIHPLTPYTLVTYWLTYLWAPSPTVLKVFLGWTYASHLSMVAFPTVLYKTFQGLLANVKQGSNAHPVILCARGEYWVNNPANSIKQQKETTAKQRHILKAFLRWTVVSWFVLPSSSNYYGSRDVHSVTEQTAWKHWRNTSVEHQE